MGHWLPWGDDMIAFNDLRDGRFVTVVMNWRTKKERVIPHPIAAVSPDGRKAISLNYARIRLTRPGYGYAGTGQDPLVGSAWPDNDGLWLVDLVSGDAKLIVPISAGRGSWGRMNSRAETGSAGVLMVLIKSFPVPAGMIPSGLLVCSSPQAVSYAVPSPPTERMASQPSMAAAFAASCAASPGAVVFITVYAVPR